MQDETKTNEEKEASEKGPVYHCKRCHAPMQNGVCPQCGFQIYVPMDKDKQIKIKNCVTAILMAIFVVLFVVLQILKDK